MKKQTTTSFRLLLIIAITFSLLLALVPAPSVAAPPALPTRPEDDIPPDNDDDGGDDEDNTGPIGAYIELKASNAPAGAWTVVQWQNEQGDWYDVEGWRGSLEAGNLKRWWVEARDFDKGPFRWVLTAGPVVVRSEPFNLPVQANQIMIIPLSVEP